MDNIEVIIQAFGLGPTGSVIALVVVSMLRAGAATVSKHVPDEKLGRMAGAVNAVGGNGKHAANG